MEKESAKNIHRRLTKIIGQLHAIDKMVDDNVECADILIQINAAKSALHKVGQIILENHINHCIKDTLTHGDVDTSLHELAKAIEHFARMS
ncbi:metal-sensitive transcriptional repressor [Helicobacter didelphidarum]|uniref:Metal-sensitive transcriptional repressor n=1 Tax=Helicobacter didelphidarum TaxID=2040648 RepID=A0A3D8IJ18_9HELI|nr:metal-sensing transcriptional repressor [Helicobacter didelphidarum]RDU64886.1 metal-sensitive transcriptional repressor [Helicobacter didelphidarum]